jgi:hypothetical protein
MTDLSSKSVCCCDSGLFPHIAQCLATQFGRVYYHAPSQHVFSHLADAVVGDGFENIERVEEPYSLIGKVDCWLFPDVGNGDFQSYLAGIGESVFGHHGADVLERRKGLFLKELEAVGLPVPEHTAVKGIENLRAFLRDREDVYIKISNYRGDFETAHWRNWTLDAGLLDCAAHRLGPFQNLIIFYVFEPLDTDIEDGVDTWRVGGEWPKRVLHAMERKDKSLIGGLQDMTEIAEPVRRVNELFGPVLDRYGTQGPFSTEVRLVDGEPYFIDSTNRFGSPPSQLQTALITNLPQVIYHGSRGELIEPESEHELGAQVLITSDREKEEWLPFDVDPELRPWVKSSFACEVDGVFTIAPNPLENWAGWMVATGDTLEAVIDTLKDSKALLPEGFDCDLTSLCDLLREMESAKAEAGIIITEQVPEPAAVLET